MTSVPRTRAPELRGRGWLNTGGRRLALADLRGRFVLLDFWTFCCVNCLHVLDELRPVEEEHRDELVVVGVHSPKFAHEADPVALAQAVERYSVEHPVLDDPELVTWQAYAARAWPTLVLVDPEGYVVAQYAGEGHGHAIDALVTELAPTYAERGTLRRAQGPESDQPFYVAPEREATDLRFPAKAARLPDGTVLVADAGHDRVALLAGDTVVRAFGEGELREPNGLCLLPADVAAAAGSDVVVADTVHHRLVGLRLDDGTVTELAAGLNSPWDVAWWQDRVWVAMAGDHTLATYDPRTGEVEHVGGTRNEGLLDGPLAEAWFAQPSGLAPDGDRLWIADAETSALRFVAGGVVTTVVGEGLFDFGFHDGPRAVARLQHPLGVLATPAGVLVADTYNGAVRRYDVATGELETVATGLAEPSGLLPGGDGGLLVVESAAHRVGAVELRPERVEGPVSRTQRPPTDVSGGEVVLRVPFTPPPGQKVDERFGPATQLQVSATPPALLRSGDGTGTDLVRALVLDPAVGDGVLHVSARAASCDVEAGEGAACRIHQQDWGVPVRITAGGAVELVLPLGGTAAG